MKSRRGRCARRSLIASRRDNIPAIPDAASRIAAIKAAAAQRQPRDNRNNQGDIMNNAIPLVTVAAEIGQDPDRLERELNSHVHRNEIGLRVVGADLAAGLIAAFREARAIEQERRQREADDQAAKRAAAKQRKQAEHEARQRLHDRIGTPSGNAFADMLAASGETGPDYNPYGSGARF